MTFSRDGTRLAIGGGAWYGHGGILIARLEDGHREMLRWEGIPGVKVDDIGGVRMVPSTVPTVSCLSFSDDNRFLAASTWLSCQHYRPTMLFYVDGMGLEYRAQYERAFEAGLDPCPTGVLIHSPYLITRNHGGDPQGDHVITLDALPSDVHATGRLQHLTHSRVVVVRDTAITEAGGSRSVSTRRLSDGRHVPVNAPEGLAMLDLRQSEKPFCIVPVEDCPRITAIAALPGNRKFATGGARGELDLWTWDGEWWQRRIRAPAVNDPRLSDHIFCQEESITGIVAPVGSASFAAVTSGGKLIRWSEDSVEEVSDLPKRGTPRSFAAHPSEPWVAVGIKQGDFGNPEAVVLIIEWR